MAEDMAAAQIRVSGRVQGVGYRFFTEKLAAELGVKGWSRNMPDGTVMLEIEAARPAAERFIDGLKEGPAMARVSDVSVSWKKYRGEFSGFTIRF